MKCWVCDSNSMSFYRDGQKNISAKDLRITDSRYGLTLPLYKCLKCGFLQCDTEKLDDLYGQLEDAEYIESSEQRKKQFKFLLKKTLPFISKSPDGRGASPDQCSVLDVGAGTGLFVKLALEHGLAAQGIEPSVYLANYAISQGIPVVNSSVPDYPECTFDAIYMTDVLEHIVAPLPLLLAYNEALKVGGALFITIPDASSLLARVMGRSWWHYRLAHVGYYNKKTLNHIMIKAGFALKCYLPVRWYFAAEYAFERAGRYLPFLRRRRCPKALENLCVPISFGDSFLSVYQKN